MLENDRRRIELLNLLLLSLPGTPVLYYGDEIGMGDNAYLGDRDGVRTPMQWSADRNGGFSRTNPQRLILPTISDPEYRYETVNVEVQEQSPSSLLWWTKRMIALRKAHPAFGRGTLHMLAPENRKVLAFLRRHADATLLVVVNLSRFPQWVELDLPEHVGTIPVELVGNGAFPPIENRPYRLTLGGYDGMWLSLSHELERQRPTSVTSPVRLAPQVLRGAPRALFSVGSPLESVLASFIPAQRWFRSKARSVVATRLLDVVPLDSGESTPTVDGGPWLAFVELQFAEGEAETYVLPLRMVAEVEQPVGVLLRIETDAGDVRCLCDGSLSPEIATLLHRLAFGEQRVGGQSYLLQGRRTGPAQAEPDSVKPIGAEQSNTSFVFGQQWVGKLVRRVEPGGSLEVEVLQALARVERRANVPTLEARIEIEAGNTLGTLWVSESFVPNEGDAWQLTIDHAQRFYEAALSGRYGDAPALPNPPAAPGVAIDFAPLARLLGRRTAELHAALFASSQSAQGLTTPKPFNALSSRAFYQSVRNLSSRAFDALKTAALPEPAAALAREVGRRKAELRRILDKALSPPLSGLRMRIHGDYHLGQVLYTGSDFYIIDFEGEPARTPAERRRLRSPLADVAGMLRSFHYAAFGVLTMSLPGARIRPEDSQQLEPWARYFFETCAREFLSAYFAAAEGAAFLGGTPAQMQTLLEIHLLEKATYELLYELNNRPAWAELPLRGLLGLLPTN